MIAMREQQCTETVDAVISYVLFRTDTAEVVRAVDQALASALNVRVVLVDNTVPPLELPNFDPCKVHRINTFANLGYGRGHNQALLWAKGLSRYHFVLNTDIVFSSDTLTKLVLFMDNRPSAGLVMPKVYYPDGRIQRLCRLLPTPIDLIGRRFFGWTRWSQQRDRKYESHNWNYESVASFPFLSGCFMALRRSVIEQVGGFDERYFLYAEDLDLSRRINAVSETLYYPFASIIHDYRSESGRGLRRLLYGIVSLGKYYNKWGWFDDPEREAINLRARAALSGDNKSYDLQHGRHASDGD
jgi:GT2 family glycosyltransferase